MIKLILSLMVLMCCFGKTSDKSFSKQKSLDFFHNACYRVEYPKKAGLIEEKKRVESLKDDYVDLEKNRFKFLGKGGFSRVYYDKEEKIVVKMIKARKIKSTSSQNTTIEEILKGVFYSYVRTDNGTVLYCEYDMKKKEEDALDVLLLQMNILKGQDFADYIWNGRSEEQMTAEVSLHTAKNLISLVADFNDIGLYHRDLKPLNIFQIEDKTSKDGIKLILIDFAFASDVQHDKKYKGTRKFMPDEMLIGDKQSDWYNQTIDSFSTGATIIELILDNLIEQDEIDLGLLYIIESMVDYNQCQSFDKNGVFCNNVDNYLEDFSGLESIKDFFDTKNRKSCKEGEILDKYLEEDAQRYFPCFQLDEKKQT